MAVAEALADGYVQARYQHVLIALTTPSWAERWQAWSRRRDRWAFHHRTALQLDPSRSWIEDDDSPGYGLDLGEAERYRTGE
jgi:hypothetical protein